MHTGTDIDTAKRGYHYNSLLTAKSFNIQYNVTKIRKQQHVNNTTRQLPLSETKNK